MTCLIELSQIGPLKEPIVLAAFAGWNDAGESATGVIHHLSKVWQAEEIAMVDPEDYYDFQVNRPRVIRVNGERAIRWPSTRILVAYCAPLDRDVVLIQGIEPSVRWRTFTHEIVEYLEGLGVDLVITLGGLLADVPHTRPLPVGVSSEEESLHTEGDEVDQSTYQGPTGIIGVLGEHSHRQGLPTLFLWVGVPHYAGSPPSPKASLSLLDRLQDLFGIVIADAALAEASRAWEKGVDELAGSDDEVAEYVRALEAQQAETDLREASGEVIAREFERYLRKRDPGES